MNVEEFQKLLELVKNDEACLVVTDPPHMTIIINLKKVGK